MTTPNTPPMEEKSGSGSVQIEIEVLRRKLEEKDGKIEELR